MPPRTKPPRIAPLKLVGLVTSTPSHQINLGGVNIYWIGVTLARHVKDRLTGFISLGDKTAP